MMDECINLVDSYINEKNEGGNKFKYPLKEKLTEEEIKKFVENVFNYYDNPRTLILLYIHIKTIEYIESGLMFGLFNNFIPFSFENFVEKCEKFKIEKKPMGDSWGCD